MTAQTPTLGLPADEIVERNSGGLEHRAIVLTELSSAIYSAAETFAYDDGDLAAELVRRCRELESLLGSLFLTDDAQFTSVRVCRACDGRGSYNRQPGEPVRCEDCNGTGADPDTTTQEEAA